LTALKPQPTQERLGTIREKRRKERKSAFKLRNVQGEDALSGARSKGKKLIYRTGRKKGRGAGLKRIDRSKGLMRKKQA